MLVTIGEILQKQNKTTYWLSKEANCDFKSLQKLIRNETSAITFELLESICIALNCTPDSLLKITKTK